MNTYIALLRGINVGGNNLLPMKQLKSILEDQLNAQNVQTYIQSGNVVFQHDTADEQDLNSKIRTAIKKEKGFEPQIMILTKDDLSKAIENNPFLQATSEPKLLHFGFLASVPQTPDHEKLNSQKRDSEQYQLIDRVFYLYTPEGLGRSKLAAKCEKILGVPMTNRNWRTVLKIRELTKTI